MPRILITVWPYAGSVNVLTGIGVELRRWGHEVAFYSGGRVRDHALSQGFVFFPLNDALDEQIEGLLSSPEGAGQSWAVDNRRLLRLLRHFFVDTLPGQAGDLDRIADVWQPDLLLCEPAMWGPRVITSEARSIPVALLELPATTVPGPDVAQIGLALPQPRNFFHRVQARIAKTAFDFLVHDIRRAVTDVRRNWGLGPVRESVMAMIKDLPLVIVPGCPEFDYQRHDLPKNLHYVGCCAWYPPESETLDWLEALPRDRPLVHASEGTMYTDRPLVLAATAEALGGLDTSVILTTGRHRTVESLGLGPLAPNVVVTPWVPYSTLLPRTDVVITHGGGGTVIACLAAGVPMVVVPLMWDQSENARRVEYTGAGIWLPSAKCTPRRLRELVAQVLKEPSYRQNANRLAQCLRQYGGIHQAAELIEGVLSVSPARG